MKIRIYKSMPFSDAELASYYKSRGYDKYYAWDEYIKARLLRPNIDAKEFYKLYEAVSPGFSPYEEVEVDFTPTHYDTMLKCHVQIKQDERGVYQMIWENGCTGSNPPCCPPDERYVEVQP